MTEEKTRYAVMRITKRGTRSLLGQMWVEDYIVDTGYVEEDLSSALSGALAEGPLAYVAKFDEHRWDIPERVQKLIHKLGLHVIL